MAKKSAPSSRVLPEYSEELLKMVFANRAQLSAITTFLNSPQRICLSPSTASAYANLLRT
jgi:hypothetical protein